MTARPAFANSAVKSATAGQYLTVFISCFGPEAILCRLKRFFKPLSAQRQRELSYKIMGAVTANIRGNWYNEIERLATEFGFAGDPLGGIPAPA